MLELVKESQKAWEKLKVLVDLASHVERKKDQLLIRMLKV
jgi:hypothetical protein